MSDEVTQQAAELRAERDVRRDDYDWMVRDRDGWKKRTETAERAVQRMTEEVQRLKDDGEQLIAECNRVSAERDAAREEVAIVITERDAAERERTESRAEVVRLRAECEGLRADLLAHPPELHQELAIERKRHLELMEDYDRREVVITTLEEALKRAENALKVAQGRHIDERLKGFLAVISQLADQSQELLP